MTDEQLNELKECIATQFGDWLDSQIEAQNEIMGLKQKIAVLEIQISRLLNELQQKRIDESFPEYRKKPTQIRGKSID